MARNADFKVNDQVEDRFTGEKGQVIAIIHATHLIWVLFERTGKQAYHWNTGLVRKIAS